MEEGKDLYQMARHYDNLRWKFEQNCFSPPQSPGLSALYLDGLGCSLSSIDGDSFSFFSLSSLHPRQRAHPKRSFHNVVLLPPYTKRPLMFDDVKTKKALCGDQFRCFTTDASVLFPLALSFVFYDDVFVQVLLRVQC
jgi:hypothetical protein